jgi:excisionase family DNA binding protein
MSDDWLSLSEVAEILGVHPSTVRSWADHGKLPVHRTQGGHRRFKRSEVELCMESNHASRMDAMAEVVQNVLRQTRVQISEGRLEEEAWYQKLDGEARGQYRQSGRYLLQGLIMALAASSEAASASANAEARALAYEYASRGKRFGLTCSEATHAFLFFRNLLIDSMFTVYEHAAIHSPSAWSEMFRRINAFTDQILVSLLETYEAYSRSSAR